MPAANNQRIKQTVIRSAAATNTPETSVRLSPETPGRTFLYIQNTGASPGLLRFAEKVLGDNGDIMVAAGGFVGPFTIPETCPSEAINVGSAAGTTWAIIEGVTS